MRRRAGELTPIYAILILVKIALLVVRCQTSLERSASTRTVDRHQQMCWEVEGNYKATTSVEEQTALFIDLESNRCSTFGLDVSPEVATGLCEHYSSRYATFESQENEIDILLLTPLLERLECTPEETLG